MKRKPFINYVREFCTEHSQRTAETVDCLNKLAIYQQNIVRFDQFHFQPNANYTMTVSYQ